MKSTLQSKSLDLIVLAFQLFHGWFIEFVFLIDGYHSICSIELSRFDIRNGLIQSTAIIRFNSWRWLECDITA